MSRASAGDVESIDTGVGGMVIVDAATVHTGKPSPEPFFRAELLGANPLSLRDPGRGSFTRAVIARQ